MQRRDDPSPELDPGWRPVAPPPTSGRDDELLADPPRGEHHLGRLAGYRAGARVRIFMLIGFAVIVVAVTAVWWTLVRPVEREPVAQFQLPAGSEVEGRPRVMTWTQGKMRFGLSREAPGVEAVELPDRTLRLAEGEGAAQFKVSVQDGKTVALQVVSGKVVEELKPGAAPLLTD